MARTTSDVVVRKHFDIQAKIEKDLTDIINRKGLDMVNDAVDISKQKGIWKTGHNARSIGFSISKFGSTSFDSFKMVSGSKGLKESANSTQSRIDFVFGSSSGYGGYLETGTRKMGARPYVRPAMEMNKDELVQLIRNLFKNA